MKIAQVTKAFSSNGGIASYVMSLCDVLTRAGHEILVLHADKNGPHDPSRRIFKVEDFDLAAAGPEKTKEAAAVLESWQPDIVHVQDCNNFPFETLVRSRFPAVRSLHIYDFCPSGTKFHHALGRACDRPTGPVCLPMMVVRRCTLSKRPGVIWNAYRHTVEANRNLAGYSKVIFPSEYVRRQAVRTGLREEHTEALYFFRECAPLQERPEEHMIMFTGRIVREKGLDLLIRALSYMKRSIPWKLNVDGAGPDLEYCFKQTRRYDLENRVQFMGWMNGNDHWEMYRRASIVAVPSVWPEPFGLVGIEAMSFAKPVVAFGSGGIPEWLRDGETGFLVRTGDYEDMGKKIEWLLANPGRAKEMGAQGRACVERDFTVERHVSRLEAIYRRAIEEKVPKS